MVNSTVHGFATVWRKTAIFYERAPGTRDRYTVTGLPSVTFTFFVLIDRLRPTVNVLLRDERIAEIREHPRDADHGIGADERLGYE